MRKASERLFISQPAVSKALQRLRDHFGNELFVKTQSGLRATEYANSLASAISPIVDSLSLAVNASKAFCPSQLTGTIKIAVTPFVLSFIATDLFKAIRKEAPHVQIQLLNWSKSTIQDLINDDIQLGVHYDIAHAPKELIQKHLITDQYYVYLNRDHPFSGEVMSIDDSSGFEFATVIAADWNSNISFVEKILKLRGLQPNIAFRSELPSVLLDIVANTEMLYPSSGLLKLEKHKGIRRLPVLLDNEMMNSDIFTYYHYKNRENAMTQWLGRIVESTFHTDN
jgi:DNA-binding transcriptional LysR family regulator